MPRYKIEIEDSFFDKIFAGEFEAPNETDATADALEYYAYELDTDADALKIVSVQQIDAPINYQGGRAIIDATGRPLPLDQQEPPEHETDEQRDAFYNL